MPQIGGDLDDVMVALHALSLSFPDIGIIADERTMANNFTIVKRKVLAHSRSEKQTD
jgi:hypothetical protein